jgi:hypothetical protein
MAMPQEGYSWVQVESYIADRTSSLHGTVHIRPVPGEAFPTSLRVECSKSMGRDYPVGTRFRIWAKLTDKEGGRPFLYTSWRWKFEVLPPGK